MSKAVGQVSSAGEDGLQVLNGYMNLFPLLFPCLTKFVPAWLTP